MRIPHHTSTLTPLRTFTIASWMLALLSCNEGQDQGHASARLITSRVELIGGDRALGEIGDYLIENEKIRVVIQKEGYSRGFGVYGGSLIDADRRRPYEKGTSGAGLGNDAFGELFPAFFLQASAVDQVTIVDDGSSGGPAKVEASGEAGDFLELIGYLNRAALGSNEDVTKVDSKPQIRYSTTYEVAPGASHVAISFKVSNITKDVTLKFPGDDAKSLLGVLGLSTDGFTIPVGDVALYGATSKVWLPGAGFDLRFSLEKAYDRNIPFPAFPGLVTEWVASRGENVSYGLVTEESDDNYVYSKKELFGGPGQVVTKSSLLVPFVASSFIGIFYQNAPPELPPGESFSVRKYFVIGDGDVGSVLDEINRIQKVPTGTFAGRVFDGFSATVVPNGNIFVYQRDGQSNEKRIYSQYTVENGLFSGNLPPGLYSARFADDTSKPSSFVDFEIKSGQTSAVDVIANAPGRIFVTVNNSAGAPIPAKVTAVGTYDAASAGKSAKDFLFDLQMGQSFRVSDYIEDNAADPSTLRYVEAKGFTQKGQTELFVRPGTYEVFSTRGPEYDLQSTKITVQEGETVTVSHNLERVVNTTGWISADTHIHSRNSIDSPMDLDERVRAAAAEGVEWAVSTDHNYVTDYQPYIDRNDLRPYMVTSVGVEMTTLESGHFNGYPLSYQVGPITHGSFEWARRTPKQIFDDIRSLGKNGPDETIVQVNHPRDQILGYFEQYDRDAFTAEEEPRGAFDGFVKPLGPAFKKTPGDLFSETTFSYDFDVLEVLNGKLMWEIHHYRVPKQLPEADLPENIPPAGTILRENIVKTSDGSVKSTGAVAFPGVVDDWFNLLNLGYQFVGVGTGDSHNADDEVGQFRTMIYIGKDNPQEIEEADIIAGLRSRHVVCTNGPMVDFFVNHPTQGVMGQTITAGGEKISLTYSISAPDWMPLARVNIYRNGILAKKITFDATGKSGPKLPPSIARVPFKQTVELDFDVDPESGEPRDSWFVIEVFGQQSMFPAVLPTELPPLVLTDAIASLAGPLGFGSDSFGALKPNETFAVPPYAITNPVWVTKKKGKFHAPGVVPDDVQMSAENDPGFQDFFDNLNVHPRKRTRVITESSPRELGVTVGKRRRAGLFYPNPNNPFDIRKTLLRMGMAHGHSELHLLFVTNQVRSFWV